MLNLVFCLTAVLFSRNWSSSVIIILSLLFFSGCVSYEEQVFKNFFSFEVDFLGHSLSLLRLFIVVLCFLASQKIKDFGVKEKEFVFFLSLLLLFLVFCFSTNNYFTFYVIFECSIIPITFIILGWGYQPERLVAGLYLIFYTIFASLPLLIIILLAFRDVRLFIGLGVIKGSFFKSLVSLIIILAFLVKFPMYFVHLWLPKAHVEAPVSGSIILAGVLLKLGGYGIIRFIPLVHSIDLFIKSFFVIISVWGGLLMSFMCLSQLDMKSLVACSSVVHMRTCIGAILIIGDLGKQGAIIMMLAHGLCSSGLFFISGFIYNRSNSRSMLLNKGLINIAPSIRMWWFLLVSVNMAAPPSINLLREINLISSIFSWRFFLAVPLMFIVFSRGAYSLFLFSLSQHGKYVFCLQSFRPGSLLDYLINFLHWAPLNIFILNSFFFLCCFSLCKILFCGDKEVLNK